MPSCVRPILVHSVLALASLLALAACGRNDLAATVPSQDPVIAAALSEQLMVDPDLARINPAYAALGGGGPATAPVPEPDRSPQNAAAARAEALHLAGGTLARAPAPRAGAQPVAGLTAALTAKAALALAGAPAACAESLAYGFTWAARMPAAAPLYPRSHATEAAGTDTAACHLRAVTTTSPVPAADMADFYWNRLGAAGLSVEHRLAGGDHLLIGRKGSAAAVVSLREEDGLTRADVVAFGL
jgi:hypothetical protein